MSHNRITFTPNLSKTLNSLNRIQQALLLRSDLMGAVDKAQAGIESDVRLYLAISKRDDSRTDPGGGMHVAQIFNRLSYDTKRNRDTIVGWVGDIKKLDTYLTKTNVTVPNIPLWWILEGGAERHTIPKFPTGKLLHFYWKKNGRWVKMAKVEHPGQTGRFFFKQAAQGVPMWSEKYIKPAFYNIFKKESGY